MAIIEFPPIEQTNEDGLLAIGGDLEIPSLLLAYSQGIFPWPINEDYPLAWFCPDPRAIFFPEKLHISKSLKKEIKKFDGEILFNNNFDEIINSCASVERKGQESTWITSAMIQAYQKMFKAGYAYCAELQENGEIVAGIYGVCLGNYFCGESMFFRRPNRSKILLIKLIQFLQIKGVKWFDTQVINPLTESLGAIEIPRDEFLKMLNESISPEKLKISKNFFS